MPLKANRLVLIDENGINTKMTRWNGRSLRGQRPCATAPFGHWMTQRPSSQVCAVRVWPLPLSSTNPQTVAMFEVNVETQRARALAKGDVIFLDDLPAHKSPIAETAIKARGA